ncbi:hypothetical protein MSSIT_2547 [Methanosarcina siciliae T4/M]|uniref:Uncharacterized protein n=1 Tax=Methanosarcina siciliae T4/M TaxID=1434120 RepID=A0A0E3L8X2_9EURY|nr:hypothetical protein MSSIT_2547 [Methanosarcina siciliae T4/M]
MRALGQDMNCLFLFLRCRREKFDPARGINKTKNPFGYPDNINRLIQDHRNLEKIRNLENFPSRLKRKDQTLEKG